jgi:hypothetical protein
MSYKNLIERFDNSKICFNISVRGDTNRGGGYGQNILLDDRCSEKYKYSKVRDKIKITDNYK